MDIFCFLKHKHYILSTSSSFLRIIAKWLWLRPHQTSQISRNITTNEMANVMRYSYLRGAGGQFSNPYDHGCLKNCSDFLINGHNEDLQASEDSAHYEGIGMVQMPRDSNLQDGDLLTVANGNGHIAINVNSSNTNAHHGHVHSSHCSHSNHSKSKTESVPLGLGLGLGRSSGHSVATS